MNGPIHSRPPTLLARLVASLHHQFIWWIVGSYVIAAILPAAGLWVRDVHLGTLNVFGGQLPISLPTLMLASLLFNAGLGTAAADLKGLVRRPACVDRFLIRPSWLLPPPSAQATLDDTPLDPVAAPA